MISQNELPVDGQIDRIIQALEASQVVIVEGETGSGKTTRIPYYLYFAGYAEGGRIGVTQPRKVAATSVAKYVAESIGVELGQEVGYQIRFDDRTHYGTRIKFMTDGILLREAQLDPLLQNYSVIMVDEAHERSLNIDFTLGLLKSILLKRSDLKVIVTSATINTQKFSDYFDGAPVISVEGRTYPVEIRYGYAAPYYNEYRRGEEVIEEVVKAVTSICMSSESGDILVFMTGKDDIDKTIESLTASMEKHKVPGSDQAMIERVELLAVYGALSFEEQQRIFADYPGKRKIVVATNIAETSITIDGIVYVVDSGYIKETNYNPSSGIGSLSVVEHSQAGCNQRAGRAGRTQPGVCVRIYNEEQFLRRKEFTEPEIKRTDLAGVLLQMKAMGIDDVESFDFIDPPRVDAFHDAHLTLRALGALDHDDRLTDIGQTMASLPLAPRLGRMLIEGDRRGCLREVATVAAFLSQRSPFMRPKGKEWEADAAHRLHRDYRSDFGTYLKLWKAYDQSDNRRDWCHRNFVNGKILGEISQVREQIIDILLKHGFGYSSSENYDEVVKAVAAGLAQNIMKSTGMHAFAKLGETWGDVYVFPGSSIFNLNADFIVCTEVVTTTKSFARGCARLDASWLPEIVPHLCRTEPIQLTSYDPDTETCILEERVFLKSLVLAASSRTISLVEARVIQEKLVAEAVANNWKKLQVVGSGFFERYATDGVRRHPVYDYDAAPGDYFCEISGFYGDEWVTPRLRYVELPGDVNKEGGDSQSKLDPADALARAWGGKVKN